MSESKTPRTDALVAKWGLMLPQEGEALTLCNALESELTDVLADRDAELEKDAGRYAKLRGWMSSGVDEGWNEVQKLAALACYMSWDDFDLYLDALGQCDVGLMYRAAYIPVSEEKP